MKEKVCALLKWAVCIMIACFFLFGGRISVRLGATDKPETVTDTSRVMVYDTIPYYHPVSKDSVVVRFVTRVLPVKADTSCVENYAQECTGNMRDSAKVVVPITQKTYETEDYKAWVSGYEASLDSLYLYRKTLTERITHTEQARQPRFGIGLTAGAGYGLFSKQPDIFVGASVYFRLWP